MKINKIILFNPPKVDDNFFTTRNDEITTQDKLSTSGKEKVKSILDYTTMISYKIDHYSYNIACKEDHRTVLEIFLSIAKQFYSNWLLNYHIFEYYYLDYEAKTITLCDNLVEFPTMHFITLKR